MNKKKVQVAVYFKNEQGIKYFLLLRTNKRRGFFWQSITGGVDKDESYFDAAKRELFEETQLKDTHLKNFFETEYSFEFQDSWNNDCIEKCFIAELRSKFEIKIDPSEHSEYKWLSEKELNEKSVKYQTNFKLLLMAKEK